MPSRRRAALQAGIGTGWAVVAAAVFLLAVYPLVHGGWARQAAQVTAYLVIVLPVFVLRPAVPLPLGWSRPTAALAVLLLAAATAYLLLVEREGVNRGLQHAVAAVSAGLGEELVFRGLVWSRLEPLVRGTAPRVVLDAALFAAYHLPVVLARVEPPATLLTTFGFGLLLAALRALTGGIGLPVAVHIAIDLSS